MVVFKWNSKEATEVCTSLLTRQRVFLLPIVIKIALLCIEDTILTDILTHLVVLSSLIGCCPVTLMAPLPASCLLMFVEFWALIMLIRSALYLSLRFETCKFLEYLMHYSIPQTLNSILLQTHYAFVPLL